MSKMLLTFTYITGAMLGALTMQSCCGHEERPVVDPSRVVVVCANTDAEAAQEATAFDAAEADGLAAADTVCAQACRNLDFHHCGEAKTLPEGKSCIRNCIDLKLISSYDALCVSRAKTVVEIRKCPAVKCVQ